MFKKRVLAMGAVFFLVALPVVFAQGIQVPGGTGLSEDSFAQVFDRILNWMLMIFVILATMAFVITGLQFIFSFGGASGTQEAAKKNLTYTIIAIFIVGGALIILNTVVGLLGDAPAGSVSNPNVDHYGRDPVGGTQNGGVDFGGVGGPFDTGVQHEPGATGQSPVPFINNTVEGSDGLTEADMPHTGL